MRNPPAWYATILILVLATTVPAAVPGASDASEPDAAECRPFLEATINGEAPDDVSPPDGSTDADALRFDVEAGFEGADCNDALNTPPVLLGTWVSPTLTRVSDSFRYETTYVDLDNDPPASITVHLDGGAPRAMTPVDPADQDYRDGAAYEAWFGFQFFGDVIVPDAFRGDHWARIEAHDGHAAADPAIVDGPRLHDEVSGTLVAPNPTNRLVIHPIANGPTFTPPTEILPPAARVLDEADGVYSHTFSIDPAAGERRAQWVVGSGAALRLDGYGLLEGEPGADSGFTLAGGATVDTRAHLGSQAVNLAPAVDAPDGTPTLDALPNSDTYRFSVVGTIRLYANVTIAETAPGLPLGVWLQLDADGDGAADACVGTDLALPPTDGWVRITLTRQSEMRVLADGCTKDVTPHDPVDGTTSLDDLQDDPAWGLMPVRSLRLTGPQNATAGDLLLVDSLALRTGVPHTTGDVDACLYGEPAEPPASPFQPMACESDIGPNAGTVPDGAHTVNVWADRMVPAVSPTEPVPSRPYLEPLAFSFSYADWVPEGPSFQLPAPSTARLLLAADEDADGTPDPGTDPLWTSSPFDPAVTQHVNVTIPFEGPDGVYGYVLTFETGQGDQTVRLPVAVQRFVNDEPTATLQLAGQDPTHRTATFRLTASDPDDDQSHVAQRLGGLATWTLAFGDHKDTTIGGAVPIPDTVQHEYKKPGSYVATLTVHDAAGSAAHDETVVVFAPGPTAP